MRGLLRMQYACVLLVVAGMLSGITGPAAAVVVNFPDANLELKVRNALSIPEPTPITDTDMETLGSFSAIGSSVSNIEGLQYAVNLNELALVYNQISDISAVSGLTNLGGLLLLDNQIETMNLSNSNLSSLQSFDIRGNPLTDVILANATLSQTTFDILMNGG